LCRATYIQQLKDTERQGGWKGWDTQRRVTGMEEEKKRVHNRKKGSVKLFLLHIYTHTNTHREFAGH